jgi:DtxR family Mn-dependent transcriptional regulator
MDIKRQGDWFLEMLDLDYQILKIIFRNHGSARLKEIQEEIMNIKNVEIPLSTINSCLERLEKGKFVTWVRYSHVELAQKGRNLAKELLRHAQLLELFLHNELELSVDKAHAESEKLNLLLSCETINKICQKYNHPNYCPCGNEIPNSDSCYCGEGHKNFN